MEALTTTESPWLDRLRAGISRVAFRAVIIGLSSGIALQVLQQPHWAAVILSWTCGVLIVLPVVNVMGVLADEIRRRDWGFALLAAAVIAVLGYALVTRLAL